MQKNKGAISIIELIIVILILSILWLVWFLSLSSYLVWVRDSTRLVELENIESSFSSYILKNWKYPEPEAAVDVTYSWAIVWTQWVFWDSIAEKVWYSLWTLDPKEKVPYTYSIKNSKKEFMLAWVLEDSPWLVSFNNYTNKAYSNWAKKWFALVNWNYNWELISVKIWFIDYVLALPSILSSNLESTNLLDILTNNRLVYSDYANLPSSYLNTSYDVDSWIDFQANDLVVYSWSINNLKISYNQISLLQNVYNSYSWNILWTKLSTNKIDSNDLFSSEPSTNIKSLACDLVNYKLKYFVECWTMDYITFFIINVLHIDIDKIPWTKITAVYQDSEWRFLFWTNQWITFYDWTDWLIYDSQNSDLVHNQISTISQDNNWYYWIWTSNWISKLDIWTSYLDTSDDIWVNYWKDVLVSTHIQYIYTDLNWTVRIWTNNWVTSYDWDVWEDYTRKSDWLSHDNITAIYTDSQLNVWFWTNSKWVDKYNISTWNIINYNEWLLPNHKVTYIFEDSLSNVWVWTEWWIWKTGDYWDNWINYTISNTSWWLDNDFITYLFEDSSLNIWIWTQWWLSKFDWTNWTKYNTWNWLLWNSIYSIYEDENYNIIIFSDWWLDTINSSWIIITE